MKKQEVAEFLNVSIRTVERYTSRGKLPCTYFQGTHGKEASYKKEDVELFKLQLMEVTHTPLVLPPTTPDSHNGELVSDVSIHVDGYEERLLSALIALSDLINPVDKLLLNISDAKKLTNLSEKYLKQAIKEGRLNARKIGKGWKVKRKDLDAFIEAIY